MSNKRDTLKGLEHRGFAVRVRIKLGHIDVIWNDAHHNENRIKIDTNHTNKRWDETGTFEYLRSIT